MLQGLAVPLGFPARGPRASHEPRQDAKDGALRQGPKALMRLTLAAYGPAGRWLENLILGPLDDTGSTR